MRDIAKKQEYNARRHRERMATDLEYRCRRLWNCVRARCLSGKGRKDWQWYGGLAVTITVADIMAAWDRDGAANMQSPDLDRKDSSIGYTRDNIQFIEHADNLRKAVRLRESRRHDQLTSEA